MWDRKELKLRGKERFKANYWRSVLSAFLISILAGGSGIASSFSTSSDEEPVDDTTTQELQNITNTVESMPAEDQAVAGMIFAGILVAIFVIFIIGFILKIFVFNPLQVGCYGFFRENAKNQNPDLGILKTGFTKYGHTFITLFLRDLFQILWTLLFIVPGVIKAYSYRMVPFILRDHPELSATQVITASRKLMNGHKWNTFVFDLSYIGWYLLGCITCGLVNVFWTEPYRQNANAALYLTLIGENDFEEEEKFEPEVVVPISQ
ncbi:MAG: DUF975 family protein [Clostridiales bacterium]|nr:DUF975 family protein [Clostridiales bacterium]